LFGFNPASAGEGIAVHSIVTFVCDLHWGMCEWLI